MVPCRLDKINLKKLQLLAFKSYYLLAFYFIYNLPIHQLIIVLSHRCKICSRKIYKACNYHKSVDYWTIKLVHQTPKIYWYEMSTDWRQKDWQCHKMCLKNNKTITRPKKTIVSHLCYFSMKAMIVFHQSGKESIENWTYMLWSLGICLRPREESIL